MPISNKIAEMMFRDHPNIVQRTITESLRDGDLIVDRGYQGLKRIPDDGIGRIRSIRGSVARVDWRDGTTDDVQLSMIAHINEPYEAALNDAAFELPKFATGTKVLLGNGDRGRIIEQVTGPTGFKSFRVQVEASANKSSVGRRVYATQNAMIKSAGLEPDVMVAFYKDGGVEPSAVIGAELAVDQSAQIVGLQKYSSLPSDRGMLFPYDPPRDVTFHMGRVRFPIDIIFIDGEGRVAAIEENCEPGYDEYWSHRSIEAVLEVNGGWCARNNIGLYDGVRLSGLDKLAATNTPVEVRHRWTPQEDQQLIELAEQRAGDSLNDIADWIYENGLIPGVSARQIYPRLHQFRTRGRLPSFGPVQQAPLDNRFERAVRTVGETMAARSVDTAMFTLNNEAIIVEGFGPEIQFSRTAQEHYRPGVNDPAQTPNTPAQSAMGADPSTRFLGSDTPDKILENQQADPAHFDQSIGYDQSNPALSNENGPGFRPSAQLDGRKVRLIKAEWNPKTLLVNATFSYQGHTIELADKWAAPLNTPNQHMFKVDGQPIPRNELDDMFHTDVEDQVYSWLLSWMGKYHPELLNSQYCDGITSQYRKDVDSKFTEHSLTNWQPGQTIKAQLHDGQFEWRDYPGDYHECHVRGLTVPGQKREGNNPRIGLCEFDPGTNKYKCSVRVKSGFAAIGSVPDIKQAKAFVEKKVGDMYGAL